MIYFNQNKEAFAFKIENPLCVVPIKQWQEFSTLTLGEEYDITSEGVVDLRETQEYQEKQAQKERERIAKLSLTKREVFLGLYQAKGVTPEMIKAQITDPMALIEFEYANDYYRFNPLIDVVGASLGITPEQLDKFFETKDYTCLLPVEVEDDINITDTVE